MCNSSYRYSLLDIWKNYPSISIYKLYEKNLCLQLLFPKVPIFINNLVWVSKGVWVSNGGSAQPHYQYIFVLTIEKEWAHSHYHHQFNFSLQWRGEHWAHAQPLHQFILFLALYSHPLHQLIFSLSSIGRWACKHMSTPSINKFFFLSFERGGHMPIPFINLFFY